MHTDVNVCRMLQERAGGTRTDEDFEADDAEAGVQLSCPPSAYWHCHFIRLPLVTPGYPIKKKMLSVLTGSRRLFVVRLAFAAWLVVLPVPQCSHSCGA